jgi:hypothetical protein
VVSRHFWGTCGLWNFGGLHWTVWHYIPKIELFIVPTVRISNTLAWTTMTVELWEMFQLRTFYSKFIVPDNMLNRYSNIIWKVSEIISDDMGIGKLQNRNAYHIDTAYCPRTSHFIQSAVNTSNLWVNMYNSRNITVLQQYYLCCNIFVSFSPCICWLHYFPYVKQALNFTVVLLHIDMFF